MIIKVLDYFGSSRYQKVSPEIASWNELGSLAECWPESLHNVKKGEILRASPNQKRIQTMSKNYFFVGTLLLSSLLVSCGATPGSTSYLGKKPLAGNAKVVLQIFAGYSCSSCNEELPEVNSRIANELNEKAALVDARVYVVAGPNWSKATQEVADRYGQELGLDQFQMMVDNRCQTEYRKYYPGT
ncbi:MAG: hypothetical protein EB120_04010, partial [Proteobacteria bacterium]|nr:hypothetical protein [Pseudomonadota bacterium]